MNGINQVWDMNSGRKVSALAQQAPRAAESSPALGASWVQVTMFRSTRPDFWCSLTWLRSRRSEIRHLCPNIETRPRRRNEPLVISFGCPRTELVRWGAGLLVPEFPE